MVKKTGQNGQEPMVLANEKALRLLKLRPHTVFELSTKLKRAGFDKNTIEAVASDLVSQDYLNDQRFAEAFLDSLIKYKTFGFYGLRAKLIQRGIDARIIEELLTQNLNLDSEQKIAEKMLAKTRETDSIKQARSLASKGFRTEVIRRVLKIHLS
jgi:regulatory protein